MVTPCRSSLPGPSLLSSPPLLSAHNRPPWASMIERLIDRPMPIPLALVVKKESKMRFHPATRAHPHRSSPASRSRRLRQRGHRPHLRIGKLRLAAGQKPRPHLPGAPPQSAAPSATPHRPRGARRTAAHTPDSPARRIRRRFSSRSGSRAMQRLQHAHRRQKIRAARAPRAASAAQSAAPPPAPSRNRSPTSPSPPAHNKTKSAATNSSHLFRRSPAPSRFVSALPALLPSSRHSRAA